MIESLKKTQEVKAQIYQEQERDVGNDSTQAEMAHKGVTKIDPNCHT